MIGLVKTKPGVGHLELRPVDVGAPGVGEVVIDVHATGVCGTDLHIADDHYTHVPPVVLGHEVVGIVSALGHDVDASWIGSRVACETFFSTCGICALCRDGRPNLCRRRVSIGSGVDGGFTGRMLVPARNLHRVPEGVEDHPASMLEPLACVVNCLCDPEVVNPGDRVLVTGPGPIGLLAAMVARAAGGEVTVAGLERDAERLSLARRLGFRTVNDLQEEFAVTIECSGSAGGVATCLRSTERGGRVAILGLSSGDLPVPMGEVCYRELTITSGFASVPRAWRRALALVREGAVDLAPLVTRVASLDEWEDVFAEVRAGRGMKAVFDPRLGVGMNWVRDFAEGSREQRELLGGKGAGVAEMTRVLGAERVPAGFTITTEACVAYLDGGQVAPAGLDEQVAAALARLEAHAGRRLGDPRDPLLVSVRSGARESMPGMLDTVLNLGLNDVSVEGLAGTTGNERFAWDSYRRFAQMFGTVVRGVPAARFESAIAAAKAQRGVTEDTELDAAALRALTREFQSLYDFPQDPHEQLRDAISAVFDSWLGERAVAYRRIHHIPESWGTAVNVQRMVFGNTGPRSGSGVAFSRDEVTGAPQPSGDVLANAQGEDVVSGVRTPRDLSELADWLPDVHTELLDVLRRLEVHYGDMQDVEFTIEDGRLFLLQTRVAKRPAQAAVRFAVDAVDEGLLSREQALATIDAYALDALLHPRFSPDADPAPLGRGVAASPGAAKGRLVFTAADAVAWSARGERVVLARPFTEADDVHGMYVAEGIVTAEGGKASHAALVARGMGTPCVAGASGLRIDPEARELHGDGRTLREGDLIALDGSTGLVTAEDVPLVPPEPDANFARILAWSDELRRLGVRANADTPDDARRALEFGAEGIGLCRTEHMFMAADRQPAVRAMILARSAEDRRESLERLLPMQRTDFEQIFTVMGRRPVTIRLLDPPLHEFLPDAAELAVALERARTQRPDDVARLERTLCRVRGFEETNPMLGTRGGRLGIVAPEIYDIQVEAIIAAARAVPTSPVVEVMLPLIAYEQELQILRDRVEAVVERLGAHDLELTIGTMIELPRACFVADRLARRADFFSFGTNDLTQTAIGLSRDDVESGFLGEYLEQRIIDRSPFETIDSPGVGWLVRLGAWVGREANPELKLGVCGEHGGDPDSIAFFDMAGLDYVSCSPFRLPVARVAAAQAAIRGPGDR